MTTPKTQLTPQERCTKIIQTLETIYPTAKTALHYTTPLEMLIATILSAQTTDAQVNNVTKTLFKKYQKPEDYANADITELEKDIHSTGFYHNKAKNLKAC
ncbi:MAG: endonuclease III, partial [Candidatus Bathyarchaeota archaeon]|nr:endonuclease III [Candidatus Bathyarchaeota archaeon]